MNQDDLLKYWTDIQGTANALSDELLSELDASDKEVLALIQKSLAKSSVQQTIQAEYEKMSALAQKIQQARAKVFAKAEKVTFEASKQVAGSVQKPAEKLVGKKLKPLKKKEISQVVDYAPYQGKTVREWFSSFQKSDVDRIVASVKEAYNSNLSVADISKKIRETFNVSKRSAETVARTVINGVANEAKLETFLKNPEVIDGIQFVAMLDGRTTFQCASLDGKIWKCSEKEKIIRPPLHPNCRSTLVPYINTGTDENGNPIEAQRTVPAEDFEAIAKQAHDANPKNKKSWDELSLSVRKSKIYKAEAEYEKDTGKPAYVRLHAGATFKDFLDKQPESFQRRWLGPERYKLYKEGKVTFNQLVKPDTGYIVPVAELKKKYGPDGDEGDQSDGGTSGNTPENTPVSPSPDKTSQNGHKMPSSDKKVKVSTKGKNDAKNEEKPAQNADTGKEEQEKLKAELEKAKKEKEELAKKTKEAEKAALLKAKQEAEEKAKAQADAKAKAEKEAEEAKYQAEQAKKKQRAAEKQIKKAKRKAQKEKRAKEAAQEKATAEAEVRKEMEDELKRLQKELGIKKAQEQVPHQPKEASKKSSKKDAESTEKPGVSDTDKTRQTSTAPLYKSAKYDIIEGSENGGIVRDSGPASSHSELFENGIRFESKQTREAFEAMPETDRGITRAIDLRNETPVETSEAFRKMYDPLAQLLEEPQREAYAKYYARLKEIDGWDEKEQNKAHSRVVAFNQLLKSPGVEEIEHKKRVAALNILFPSNNPESDNRKYLRELPIDHGDKKDHSKDDEAVRFGLDFFGRVMDNAGIDIQSSGFKLEGYSGEGAHYMPDKKLIHLRNGSFTNLVQDIIHEAAHHWEDSLSVDEERKNGLVDMVEAFYKQITTDSKGKQYPAKQSKQFSGKFRKANIKLPPDEYITRETGEPCKEILQEFMRLLYTNPARLATQYPEWFDGMMRFLR